MYQDEIKISILGPDDHGRHFSSDKERPVEIEVGRKGGNTSMIINMTLDGARELAQRLTDMLREYYERTGE